RIRPVETSFSGGDGSAGQAVSINHRPLWCGVSRANTARALFWFSRFLARHHTRICQSWWCRAGKERQLTIPMCTQETIRSMDADGVPGREIARQLGISRDSVAKYSAQADFSPAPPPAAARPGAAVLAGLTKIIDGWLADDQRRPAKQRHTATRIFDRLAAEHGYTGSYSPVQRYVRAWRQAHQTGAEGFNELAWPAGTVQVDFGQAEAIIAGVRMVLHMLIVTFPFSNMRFAQAYRGETAECITHGLRTIFEHIGAAPRDLVFDNATGAGRRAGQRVIESKLFSAFKLH